MNKIKFSVFSLVLVLVAYIASSQIATATSTITLSGCAFEVDGSRLYQIADCQPTQTIRIPNGYEVVGTDYTISATGDFLGAVVQNDGPFIGLTDVTITTLNIGTTCRTGDARLRGLVLSSFERADIRNLTISNINKGSASCVDGFGMQVINSVGSPLGVVNISDGIRISNYQSAGILVSRNVSFTMTGGGCHIGSSATQQTTFAYAIQVSENAYADIQNCRIGLNSNVNGSLGGASSIGVVLSGAAPGTTLRNNLMMEGNAEYGIYLQGDGYIVENNKVHETGADRPVDVGIRNNSMGNFVYNNKIRGFNTPIVGPSEPHNVLIPSPQEIEN